MKSRRDDDMDGSPLLASLILYSPDERMPLDAAFALTDHNSRRPGILSGRADQEEGADHAHED